MKMKKRFGALLLTLVMLLVSAPVAAAAEGTIIMNLGSNMMTVNGSSVAIDADPAIKPQVQTVNGAGFTMLPLRAVVESMGGTVAYDAAAKNITMTYGGTTVTHVIGTSTAYVNGTARELAIASYAANNRTYVHLRAIELLSPSIVVKWNANDSSRVEITYPQNAPVTILPDVPVIIDPGTTDEAGDVPIIILPDAEVDQNRRETVQLTVINQSHDTITELKVYPASDHSEPLYLYAENLCKGDMIEFELEGLEEDHIVIYAQYTYYDYVSHSNRHNNFICGKIELKSDEAKITLQPFGRYEIEI